MKASFAFTVQNINHAITLRLLGVIYPPLAVFALGSDKLWFTPCVFMR
jgi:hypothetical protein